MSDHRVHRRLRAIVSADAVGYSRLMGLDEGAAIAAIKALRSIFAGAVEESSGRVVDSTGDNILAEFGSAVDAVRCSVKIQRRIERHNAAMPQEVRMRFRIGINIGDIVFDENRIYGDGVNIAARIEALADPGGISVSRAVHEQVRQKLDVAFEDQGTHAAKNIAEPVHVFRLLADAPLPPREKAVPVNAGHNRAKRAAAAFFLIFAGAGLFLYAYRQGLPSRGAAPLSGAPGSGRSAAAPSEKPPTIPAAKPAIAVLPFTGLTGNESDDYFIDGMTHDIITDLSKIRELLVIAANTMFTYRGKSVDVRELGTELKVRYILEGAVQKAGNRVLVNAQLIEAQSGHHIWAERYDRETADVFSLQDELVKTIVGRLAVRIDDSETGRALRKPTENLQAYDYLLRGRHHLRKNRVEEVRMAREMAQKALELDPRYASAYTEIARTYYWEYLYGTLFPDKTLDLAEQYARKALELDDFQAGAHEVIGSIAWRRGRFDAAIARLRRAVHLNPNDATNQNRLGTALLYAGQTDESIFWKESSFRLDPRLATGNIMTLALGYYLKGRYEEAVKTLQKGLSDHPDYLGNHIVLAACYAKLNRSHAASAAAERVLQLDPFFTTARYGSAFRMDADREKIVEGLREAGLP